MSEGMNRVLLLGNVGHEPELRYGASGTAYLRLRIATNESYVDKNKEVQERTEWHTVVVFGPRAEGLSKVLTKGACVLVEGNLRSSSYEKDGQKRTTTEVHAREIYLTARRPAGAAVGDEGRSQARNGVPKPAFAEPPLDDMPF